MAVSNDLWQLGSEVLYDIEHECTCDFLGNWLCVKHRSKTMEQIVSLNLVTFLQMESQQ